MKISVNVNDQAWSTAQVLTGLDKSRLVQLAIDRLVAELTDKPPSFS